MASSTWHLASASTTGSTSREEISARRPRARRRCRGGAKTDRVAAGQPTSIVFTSSCIASARRSCKDLPGTGKTYNARRYLKWFTADRQAESRLTAIALTLPESERTPERIADQVQTLGLPGVWEIAQFHPSYSYERFVRGLQSTPVPGGVSFVAVNRVLGTLAAVGRELASRGDSAELLLMVDEINRGDIAKVFGELLYALEYRDEPVTTPYAIDGDPTPCAARRTCCCWAR